MSFKVLLQLLRVRQWAKNFFLAIPAFFAGRLLEFQIIPTLFGGIAAFSFVASGIYIINDYKDKEIDSLHPKKKLRPLASGAVSIPIALSVAIGAITLGLVISGFLSAAYFWCLLTYLLINLGYSIGLKNVSILDILIVSSGFVIRIYAGGILTEVAISQWLAIMVFLLALFLVVAKRKDDLIVQETTGKPVRKSMAFYNPEFVNSLLTLLSGVILVAYLMYTLSPEVTNRFGSEYLFATSIFVIAGIMRYLQIAFVEKQSGSPTEIFLTDKFIVATLAGWVISFYFLIYF
jgi:decaprenyl-phosphate phosphoribosyltransferase